MDHLQQDRSRQVDEASRVALEWAIVNVRVVKDAMDTRSRRDPAARDRAMARMVKWILDHSPKSPIVLWAHNGHVQRQPGSMGAFLEEMFPGQMVVLGFATGTGTYRAVSRAGRGLATHVLAPPPPDSFEHAFQATGLSRFVLDLRKAVPRSSESGWLLERRPLPIAKKPPCPPTQGRAGIGALEELADWYRSSDRRNRATRLPTAARESGQ